MQTRLFKVIVVCSTALAASSAIACGGDAASPSDNGVNGINGVEGASNASPPAASGDAPDSGPPVGDGGSPATTDASADAHLGNEHADAGHEGDAGAGDADADTVDVDGGWPPTK